jgi:hypothetical protein
MQTATSWSLLPRISAILLVLTLAPLATLAQDNGALPAIRVLFKVAYAEKDITAARQHLVNALESGGSNEPETAAAREQIRRINAELAAAPPE